MKANNITEITTVEEDPCIVVDIIKIQCMSYPVPSYIQKLEFEFEFILFHHGHSLQPKVVLQRVRERLKTQHNTTFYTVHSIHNRKKLNTAHNNTNVKFKIHYIKSIKHYI